MWDLGFYKVRQHALCADGFQMSVQASHFHHCEPRDNKGPYTLVEVGYLSQREPLLEKYMCPVSGDVGNFVPVGVVRAVLKKHGGLVSGELPPGV